MSVSRTIGSCFSWNERWTYWLTEVGQKINDIFPVRRDAILTSTWFFDDASSRRRARLQTILSREVGILETARKHYRSIARPLSVTTNGGTVTSRQWRPRWTFSLAVDDDDSVFAALVLSRGTITPYYTAEDIRGKRNHGKDRPVFLRPCTFHRM